MRLISGRGKLEHKEKRKKITAPGVEIDPYGEA
jgi:hypothetical protein